MDADLPPPPPSSSAAPPLPRPKVDDGTADAEQDALEPNLDQAETMLAAVEINAASSSSQLDGLGRLPGPYWQRAFAPSPVDHQPAESEEEKGDHGEEGAEPVDLVVLHA